MKDEKQKDEKQNQLGVATRVDLVPWLTVFSP